MLTEFNGLTTECHHRTERQLLTAWNKPLPVGAARLSAAVFLAETSDGTAGLNAPIHAKLKRTPDAPWVSRSTVKPQPDYIGSASWLEPPGTILLGVITISGTGCRKDLLTVADVLLDSMRSELERVCIHELSGYLPFETSCAELPTAEDMVEAALGRPLQR